MSKINQEIEKIGVEESTAIELHSAFDVFFNQAMEWKQKAEELIVTDASQKHEIKQAREGRLLLKSIRVDADKKRKAMKSEAIKYSKAVQAVYNLIEDTIKPIEAHLKTQEDFVKIQKEKEDKRIREIRMEELSPYMEFVQPNLDLAGMEEDSYIAMRDLAKMLTEAKAEKEEKERLEQIEKERLEAEEMERVKAENERLKAEAMQRDKEQAALRVKAEIERKKLEEIARIEREKQQAKIEEERNARLKLEAEANAIREEKERIEREQAEADRKAANAPDREKLIAFAKSIESLAVSVEKKEALAISNKAQKMLLEVALFIRESAGEM